MYVANVMCVLVMFNNLFNYGKYILCTLIVQSLKICDSGSAIMKAVLFDLGGVLVSAPQLVIARYEKSLGLPP